MLLLNLGGAGNRSRRGFGSLQLVRVDDDSAAAAVTLKEQLRAGIALEDGDGLARFIEGLLLPLRPNPARHSLPEHPVFDPQFAKVVVCKRPFAQDAHMHPYAQPMVDFWDVLRSRPFRDRPEFGGDNPRQASPVIFHLAKVGGNLHLVITAFKTELADQNMGQWLFVQQFLNEFVGRWWQGEMVYGQGVNW